jgi:hypothetical protein
VVYAGHGDALAVQDEGRLFPIDSGPLGNLPGRLGGAPYWRLYYQALLAINAEIDRPLEAMLRDGVVASHAHADHYGGFAEIFQRALSPTYAAGPTPGKPLVFNGPLVSQVLDDQEIPAFGSLEALLADFHFATTDEPNPSPLLDAFTFSLVPDYSVYERRPDVRPAVTWGVDTSAANLASVLMAHDETGMVFTGDSAGYLVLEFLDFTRAVGLLKEPIPILKVPHHGSLRNSQRGQLLGTVPALAWQQYGLLCIGTLPLDDAWNQIEMPADLRDAGPVAVAKGVLDAECEGVGVDPGELVEKLRTAFDRTLDQIANNQPNPFAYTDYPAATIRKIWLRVRKKLETLQWQGRGTTGVKRARVEAIRPSWVTQLLKPTVLPEVFYGRMALVQLQRFFTEVSARNHVISADGTYSHPAAETLAAIAMAAKASGKPARVLVTSGEAVDFSRLQQLAPDWPEEMELRYLARGRQMVLNPEEPGPVAGLDPSLTTANLMPVVTLAGVHAQFQANGGVAIPAREAAPKRVVVFAPAARLYLNFDAYATISVTPGTQGFYVDQAWLLGTAVLPPYPFPGSFDDVRLRVADQPIEDVARLVTLFPRDGGYVISVKSLLGPRMFVCNNPGSNFLTEDPDDPTVLAFTFAEVATDDDARAGDADQPVSLRAYCEAVGVPTEAPLSCTELLPQLVGPDAAATLDGQILSHVIQRALGWNADLDASTVTYTEDEYGPLVSAAEVVIELGTPLEFTVDDQRETIASAALSLQRTPEPDTVAIAGSVVSEAGTTVLDDASEVDPPRSRPLDQYLFDLGVPIESWAALTAGTLLSAIAGAEPIAEELVLAAPSPIVTSGLAEWTLDHEASEVETELTSTGGYTEIRSARVALRNPAPISQDVGGLALSYSELALAVSDARLPTAEVALEAVATAGPTRLDARTLLSAGDCTTTLTLPEGSDLEDVLALLPAAGAIAGMEVPLAGVPLGGLGLGAPAIEVHQPSPGAEPYELAAVEGTVAFDGWQRALPSGWPVPATGVAEVRVLDPLDPEHAMLALEVSFETTIGPATVATELRASPLPTSPPTWAHAVSASFDPTEGACTAPQALDAVGLSGARGALESQLPALAPVLGEMAVAALTLNLPPEPGSAEEGRVEMTLISEGGWELVPGIVSLGAAGVELAFDAGSWSATVEGEGEVGVVGLVGVSAQLATPELDGAISFENAGEDLTLAALVGLCNLGDLGAVPIVGGLAANPVAQVELVPAHGQPASQPAAVGFSIAIEPLEVGVLDLSWASVEVARRLDGLAGASTAFWLEASWGEDLVASLFYDDAEESERLNGELRPIAPVELGDALTRLLGETAESTLLPAVAALPMRNGTLVQETTGFELLSCEVAAGLTASLPVAAANASALSARWAAAHEEDGEEVPEVYLLAGRLTREEVEPEATIEIEFRGDEEAETVAGAIGPVPDGEPLTAAGLLELLDLERPEVLTPEGAPEFFELEVTSATATFSVDPFQLETLTVLVETQEKLTLLPAPAPIELLELAMEVDYDRQADPATSGFVSGKLPLEPKPVTLRYVQPEGEEPEFLAEVTLEASEAPEYRQLTGAEPYDPGYELPEGLGIPAAIPMSVLRAAARPGEFVELRGHDEATAWKVTVGQLTMEVEALGGSVRVEPGPDPEAEHSFELSLFGRLAYHGFVGSDASFTWGPERSSVLTASATEDPTAIDLAAIAGALGTAWADLVAAETPAFAFAAAWTYADLTASALCLYGDGALGEVAGPAALLGLPAGQGRRYAFLFGAAEVGAFPLTPLWRALGAVVDGQLSLEAGNLAVLTAAENGPEMDADLATVAEYAERQGVEYSGPFDDLPPLADELPEGAELEAGLSLVAAVDPGGSGSLSAALARIADDPAQLPLLLTWGSIDHAEPRLSALRVKLTGLVLLGGAIAVEGVADYVPSAAEALVAPSSARVDVGTAAPYAFPGTLTIEAEAASFVTGDGELPPIEEPLGMTGIDLLSPRLTATYDYPPGQPVSAELRVLGSVELEVSGSRRSFDGAIEFAAGAPAVAVFVVAGTEMPVTDIYTNAMTSGSWPAGYPSFDLESPRIYAAPRPVTIEGVEYEQGYHAIARSTFFATAFDLDVAIEPVGLRAAGAGAAAIDLVYLTLGEPEVTVDTTDPAATAYVVGGEAAIFQDDFGRLDFTCSPGAEWEGAVTYDGKLVEVEDPTVRFGYSDAEGLRLLEWPLRPRLDDEQLDWEETLEEASKDTECGELEDLGLDNDRNKDKTIETSFDLTMAQTGPVVADALPLVLRGTYTVVVRSEEGETTTTMAFPETSATIEAASAFQLGWLEAWVREVIEGNREALGKSLLEEPDSEGERGLKSFMEPFDLGDADATLLERLLCREDDSENVRERTEEVVEEAKQKAQEWFERAKSEAGSSKSSSTIGGAGGGAAGGGCSVTAGVGLIFGLGGLGGFGGLIGFAWGWLPLGLREEWEKLVEEEQPQAEVVVAEATERVEKELLRMRGAPKVEFTGPTAVAVSWDEENLPACPGIDYEGFKDFTFEVQISIDSDFGTILRTATATSTERTLTIEAEELAHSSYVYARLRPILFALIPGTWISERASHRIPLPAPATVSQALESHRDEVVVTVETVAAALSYVVELLDTDSGKTLASRSIAKLGPGPAPQTVSCAFGPDELPTQAFGQPPLRLLARAKAVGNPNEYEDSPFTSAPEDEAIATIGPPRVNEPVLAPDGVQVSWEAVPETAGYVVRVLDSQGQPLSPQPEVTMAGTACTLSGPGIVDGAALEVEVRAGASAALGLWGTPVPFVVHALPAPAALRALFYSPEDLLKLSWEAVAAAASYEVGVADGQRRPLSPTVKLEPGPSATVSGPGILADAAYFLRVRATAAGFVSTWSEWLPITTTVAAAPAGASLTYRDAALLASWQLEPGASRYSVELDREGSAVASAEPEAPPAVFDAATGVQLAPSASYTAKIRAVVGTSVSPPAEASATIPTLLAIAMADWDREVSVVPAAAECLALEPRLGPAQLWYTLLAGGYASEEATRGVRGVLPATTPAQIEAIGRALGDRPQTIALLHAEGVPGAVIVGLCRALYSPVPIDLAVLLKLGGLGPAGLAQAFAETFGMSLAAATLLIEAVFEAPWRFGAAAREGRLNTFEAAAELRRSYSPSLPSVPSVVALVGGQYPGTEIRSALGIDILEWELIADAVYQEPLGRFLAAMLRNQGVGRADATEYVATCWPELSPAQVAAAIESAYGP